MIRILLARSRAAIRPEQVGVRVFGRRRVPGLRREELAQLAGVKPDYYIRLAPGTIPASATYRADQDRRRVRITPALYRHR